MIARHQIILGITLFLGVNTANAQLRKPYRPLATIRRAGDVWKTKRDKFNQSTSKPTSGLQGVTQKEEPKPAKTASNAPIATPNPSPAPTDLQSVPATTSATPAKVPVVTPAQRITTPTSFVFLMQQNAGLLIRKTLGIPYVGGTFSSDPEIGFSTEGLPFWVLKELGFSIPRAALDMAKRAGVPIDKRKLQTGDLLFFHVASAQTKRSKIFVGIYFKDGKFAYPSYTAKKVVLSNLYRPFWQKRFILARRVISNLQ